MAVHRIMNDTNDVPVNHHLGSGADLGIHAVSGRANKIDRRYLTPKEASRYLSLSVFSIYRLVQRRAIPFHSVHPSRVRANGVNRPSLRFDVKALDAWMRKQVVKPAVQYVDESSADD
jgi:excisionase family DNA binding protein